MKACPNCQMKYPAEYTHCPQDGIPLVGAAVWGEGTLVRGKYRILGKVGQGGMATVYKALHTRFGELRALKVMNTELASDAAFVKMFMREAILARKLLHSNAVRVDDIDEAEDGRPFIVMEYIEGHSLKDAIQTEGPMPLAKVCPIIVQVAGALDAAHRLGIVHRDIKPANIVLMKETSPSAVWPPPEIAKVLDFGIAKAKEVRLDDSTQAYVTITETGRVIGTPAYMSPEQARGVKGDQLDGRSDLYSLAIVMYQMLAGELPFRAETTIEWILAHVQTPPEPLARVRPELHIPEAIEALVMQCLEKDRNLRPESAAVFINELQRARQELAPLSPSSANLLKGSNVSLGHAADPNRRPQPAGATKQGVAEVRVASHLPPPTSRRSHTRGVWLAAAISALLITAAVVAWRTNLRARLSITSASGRAAAPNVSASPEPPSPQEGISPSSAPLHTLPETPVSARTAESVPAAQPKAVVATGPGNAGRTRSSEAGKISAGEAAATERLAQALRRERVADAVGRAQDDEGRGDFEEALKEYERASELDPSNADLKNNVRRIQNLIEKEKTLIP